MRTLKEQQILLQRLGYSVTVDGKTSSQLTRSIKAFQRDLKREETGILSQSDVELLEKCVRNHVGGVNTHA